METLSWDHFLADPPGSYGPVTVTVGVFDGVHLGHRRLIDAMKGFQAHERYLISFRKNPRTLLRPEMFPGNITTVAQKERILEDLGIDKLLLIDFSDEFSTLSGREFLAAICKRIPVDSFVLGDNFRCGRRGDTSSYDARDLLKKSGIEVVIPEPFFMNGAIVSSTRIRASLMEGDFSAARAMTERAYILDAAALPQHPGSGAITIHRSDIDQILPPPGSYDVYIARAGESPKKGELQIDAAAVHWPDNDTRPAQTIEFASNKE